MTEGGIIAIAGIAAGAWLIRSVAVPAVKGAFKTEQENIRAKVETSKNNKEKAYYEQTQRSLQAAISGIADINQELEDEKKDNSAT